MSRILVFILCVFFSLSLSAKSVEIILWHSLAGHLGEVIKQVATDFNNSQQEFAVKPVYKGEYTEALTSFAAAFRAKHPPAIVQIFEVGTGTMLYPKGIIKPVDQLMQEQGLFLPKASFLPAIRDYYSENDLLLAMPFNSSVPVVYYNADVIEKLGYSPNTFPRTWDEMEVLASKLIAAGYQCAYTSAYPGWIQIESFLALHGFSMFEAQSQRAIYNNSALIAHLDRLKKWQTRHYFVYGGRASNATVLFTSGHCAMFSQSSGSHNSLAELVKFRLGVTLLPFDERISKTRFNNVAGGAALWVVAGQKPIIERGIAQFFSYLARPEVQQHWHQQTGYLPLGTAGIYAKLIAGQQNHSILALAQMELAGHDENQKGSQTGPQNQIRIINDEAIEAIFAGIKTPKQALDEAVARANYAIDRFARNTS